MLISYYENKKSSQRLLSWQPSLISFNTPIYSGSTIKPCTLKLFQVPILAPGLCRFDILGSISSLFCILAYAIIYVLIHHIMFWLYLYFLNILYFFKYSCTNIFHRRSLCTFYGNFKIFFPFLVIINVHSSKWGSISPGSTHRAIFSNKLTTSGIIKFDMFLIKEQYFPNVFIYILHLPRLVRFLVLPISIDE